MPTHLRVNVNRMSFDEQDTKPEQEIDWPGQYQRGPASDATIVEPSNRPTPLA